MLIQIIRNAGNMTPQQIVFSALLMFFALALSFSIHEFMHAFVANALGDDIPRLQGRLTLNPVAHLDPMGTVLILLVGFGWGKPVMYNPNNLYKLKSKRLMNIMVHLAGVTGNFILGLLAMIIAVLIMRFTGSYARVPEIDVNYYVAAGLSGAGLPMPAVILVFICYYIYTFSIMLMAFNLIPLPPLDGSHVLMELLPYKVRYSDGFIKFERFAPMILMLLIVLGSFSGIDVLSTLVGIISIPAKLLINLVCGLIGSIG